MIYLDHAATTPVDPAVREVMLPFLGEAFGNPSSIHQTGQRARRALDAARDAVAETVGAVSEEIVFTSGGTEANALALVGSLLAGRAVGRDHLVTSTAEHHAVLDTARFVEEHLGFSVTRVSVDGQGRVDPAAVAAALTDRTALVSILHGNNEVGTIQPIAHLAQLAHARGALLHTDAVQTLGQLPITRAALDADLITLSAHKIYGPKGVGALVIRRGVRLVPWLHGGAQERERRAGTEDVAGVVGFGEAARRLALVRDPEAVRQAALRDAFLADLRRRIPGVVLNGPEPGPERLPNHLNVSIAGVDGETLLLGLDLHGIAASSGSACASGSIEPSHVLLALGLPLPLARAAVRLTVGRATTAQDLDVAARTLQGLSGHG